MLLAAGAMSATQATHAQVVPNPFGDLPDVVGPVDDASPDAIVYDPSVPAEVPDDIRAIDMASPVMTLEDALLRAYWFNPQLLAQRATLRATDYALPQARARFGPSIDYSIGLNWQRDEIDNLIGNTVTRSGRTSTVSAVLTQPLYTFGRLAAGERGARARIAYERARLKDAEQQILYFAIAAYVGLLRDRTGLQIARDNLALLDSELGDIRERFAVGNSTETDLLQVDTRVSLARAELLAAEAALARSEADFLATVGSPAGELTPPAQLRVPVASIESAQEVAQFENPVLEASRAREQASRAAADAAFSDRLPRVDLQGRADFGTVTPYENDPRQTEWRAGVVLSGPLFDSGLLAARQKQAEAANDADWRLIDFAMRDLRAEVATTWARREATSSSVASLASAVDSAARSYEGALTQQRGGFRTTLDVLILARELLTVRTSYNTTIADAYLSEARLLLALGALDLAQLVPSAATHDAKRHAEKVDGRGELPWTPVLDALDGLGHGDGEDPDRPVRDPALAPSGQGSTGP